MEICLPVSHYHLTGKTRIYIHGARKRSRIASTLWLSPALPRRRRFIKESLFLRISFTFFAVPEKDREYFILAGADLRQKSIAANTKRGMGLVQQWQYDHRLLISSVSLG